MPGISRLFAPRLAVGRARSTPPAAESAAQPSQEPQCGPQGPEEGPEGGPAGGSGDSRAGSDQGLRCGGSGGVGGEPPQGPDGSGDGSPASEVGSDCVPAGTSNSEGRASGQGSRPPANFTSAWTRDSTEGWVANRSAKPSRGLSTHNSITAEVAPGNSPRPSILRSAEIMASGFLVSSTEPASARYSRVRDSASLTHCDSSQASTISTTAMMTITTAAPP